MERGNFEFLHGNIMISETWSAIREKAPFDFSLCCGILYHVPDYEFLLRNIASVTNDVVLIDTRISDNEEFVEEPGGWFFNAIVETRFKKTPVLENVVKLMTELGFRVERLSINEPTPDGLKGPHDDYNEGKRTTLLAIKMETKQNW